ncbi:MAG: type II secretion system minor pseudopilin GspK [Pseudomonadota bacterium]
MPQERESGAALLSVLMVVAAMSVVALVSVEAIARATRLAQLTSTRTDVFWFARSAEAAGKVYVSDLYELTNGRLSDATPRIGEPITQVTETGALTARLDDATNCFNLNALVEPSDIGWTVQPAALGQLETLFSAMGLGQYESDQMAHALADWIDSDTVSRPSGAEDGYYGGLEPSYRTPGGLLENIREVKAVGPFDGERYRMAKTVLCVRPDRNQSVLNVNTLQPEQAGLLTALFSSELEPEIARQLIASRPLGGWPTIDAFLALEPITEIASDAMSVSTVDVVSSHFSILGEVSTSGQITRFELLYGIDNDSSAALLWRRYGDD